MILKKISNSYKNSLETKLNCLLSAAKFQYNSMELLINGLKPACMDRSRPTLLQKKNINSNCNSEDYNMPILSFLLLCNS